MLRLVAPGIAAVAVTFGMARYGYGLFVPDLRSPSSARAAPPAASILPGR